MGHTKKHGVTRTRIIGLCDERILELEATLNRRPVADELAARIDELNSRRPDLAVQAQDAVARAVGVGR